MQDTCPMYGKGTSCIQLSETKKVSNPPRIAEICSKVKYWLYIGIIKNVIPIISQLYPHDHPPNSYVDPENGQCCTKVVFQTPTHGRVYVCCLYIPVAPHSMVDHHIALY